MRGPRAACLSSRLNGSCSACWASEESAGLRGGGPHPRSPTSQQLACFLRPHRLPPAPSPALLMRGHQALSVNCPLGLGVVAGMGADPGLRRPGGPGKAWPGGGQRQIGWPLGAGPWLVSCLKMLDPHLVLGCWPPTIPDDCVGASALGAEEGHVNVKYEPGGSSRPRLTSVWVCWGEKERQGCCACPRQGAVLLLMVEEREWGGEWAGGSSHLREPGQAATPELSHLLRLLSPTEDTTAPQRGSLRVSLRVT